MPLSIVHLRGLDRSQPHPTLLEGYGNYGLSISPRFDRRRIAWLGRGGIYAVAHVCGGGEFGEEWHRAGMKRCGSRPRRSDRRTRRSSGPARTPKNSGRCMR